MKPAPERGDVICVRWIDTAEDPVGNPDLATLAHRTSYGLFYDFRKDGEFNVLVTTTTIDTDGSAQAGYCIYPADNIVNIEVLKKAKKAKKKKLEIVTT
jgi:hypothetical protein